MAHETLTFADVYGKITENNPPYPDGRLTALGLTPHQRRGGLIVEFAYSNDEMIAPQMVARGNFGEALASWGEITDAYRMLPKDDLVVGSVAIDFRSAPVDDGLSSRQVLAAIGNTPLIHLEFLRTDELIG